MCTLLIHNWFINKEAKWCMGEHIKGPLRYTSSIAMFTQLTTKYSKKNFPPIHQLTFDYVFYKQWVVPEKTHTPSPSPRQMAFWKFSRERGGIKDPGNPVALGESESILHSLAGFKIIC